MHSRPVYPEHHFRGRSPGPYVPTQELPQLQSLHAFIHDSLYTPGVGGSVWRKRVGPAVLPIDKDLRIAYTSTQSSHENRSSIVAVYSARPGRGYP